MSKQSDPGDECKCRSCKPSPADLEIMDQTGWKLPKCQCNKKLDKKEKK